MNEKKTGKKVTIPEVFARNFTFSMMALASPLNSLNIEI